MAFITNGAFQKGFINVKNPNPQWQMANIISGIDSYSR